MAGAALSAREAALAPPRAYREPLARAQARTQPDDFLVEEELGFAPDGQGQHLLLKVRKRDANTQWVARALARLAGCRAADVGYAGLKDRRAVAVQWFSVPRPRSPPDWGASASQEFVVLEAHPHARKLPRGALTGNHFTIRLRAPGGDGAQLAATLAPRIQAIASRGVPNYFGPQRFGRDGGNLKRTESEPGKLRADERGFVLSAARSALFNALLAERVFEASWERLLEGDLAILDGRGSFFAAELSDESIAGRCQRLEIHPSGPLWGVGTPASGAGVLELECRIGAHLAPESALCVAAGMQQERRALRLAVHGLSCAAEDTAAVLRFRLARGSFATAVLRELTADDADVPDA